MSAPLLRPTGAKSNTDKPLKQEKTPEQVQKDIQDIMRQITSSVTFLPALEEKCACLAEWLSAAAVASIRCWLHLECLPG